MDGKLTLEFLNISQVLDDREYLKTKILYWAAPTLLKKKPATLLALKNDYRNTYDLWNRYREGLECELSLCPYVLRDTGKSSVVLFYDEALLTDYVMKEKNKNYLLSKGYPPKASLKNWLLHLKARFQKDMPHEIGIFLGIPLEDVNGFVENKGKDSILNGAWKVYHNPEEAEKIFKEYDAAREEVIRHVMRNWKEEYVKSLTYQ